MRQEQFTPAPWFAIDYCGWISIQSVDFYEEKNNLLDAECCGAYEANGILAAAAPDLYEALKHMLWMSEKWGREWFDKETWAKVELAKAALAKANPQSQPTLNK